MPLIFSPPALSHINANRFVRIENTLIVAMSPNYDCGGDDDVSMVTIVINILIVHMNIILNFIETSGIWVQYTPRHQLWPPFAALSLITIVM